MERRRACLAVVIALAACGGGATAGGGDGGVVAVPDVVGEVPQDAPTDRAAETGNDARPEAVAPDAPPEAAAPDASPDPAPDPAPDALPDPAPDPAPDALPDPAPDALPDPAPDPAPDALPDPSPDAGPDGASPCGAAVPGVFPVPEVGGWAAPNAYSWNGSWTPADGDFPIPGLIDDEYGDGHLHEGVPTPILPPGEWDYEDANDDFAIWKGFEALMGTFEPLLDGCGRQFGWRLVPVDPKGIDMNALIEAFDGSPGTDVLDLGPYGLLHSTTGQLGDGPDVLVYKEAWSLDFRTGSTLTGALHDDDLIVADCVPAGADLYNNNQMCLHTGPGADLVFIRDVRAGCVDLGNGAGGRTDAPDPGDGDDVVVIRGNVTDTRLFGGWGDDTFFWYLDENKDVWPGKSQGGNIFGGGSAGDAIWGDPGTDRLVLVVPDGTVVVEKPATPNGAVLIMTHDDALGWDAPTVDDPFAKYCWPCGTDADGRQSLILDYNSADGTATTGGYVYLTAIEELQIGVGPAAKVYRLDQVKGKAVPAPDLAPVTPPAQPVGFCGL
ncbi:MAG: hypothetical protein FJ087_03560 [Deltaproteobacteria bacterium]|nr:hypothetical protein [Deltaproteobacteria bacterium]